MEVTFKDDNIYFSDNLSKEAKLRAGNSVFMFSISTSSTFGFHKADSGMAKSGILVYPVKKTPTGKLYITPIAPPVGLIKAVMRLSFKRKKTIKVEKSKVNDLDIFILKK